ncbi:hypothetical protein ACLOJK_015694 [Asimina triloba]
MSKSSTASPSPISVKDAIYKLQLSLFEGITREPQLVAAGSVLSKSDYQDVAVERSIANLCGYPLCSNALPSDDSGRRGRYRISLKEHKVYDLEETRMYCSASCLVNSRAFAGSLEDERVSDLDLAKVARVLRLFEELGGEEEKGGLGKNGDLGFGKLTLLEKSGSVAGEVAVDNWIGPSNAIEGYVPQRDRSKLPSRSKHSDKEFIQAAVIGFGYETRPVALPLCRLIDVMVYTVALGVREGFVTGNETGFSSDIIVSDQSSTVKVSSSEKKRTSDRRSAKSQGKVSARKTDDSNKSELESSSKLSGEKAITETGFRSIAIIGDQAGSPKSSSASWKSSLDSRAEQSQQQVSIEKTAETGEAQLKSSLKPSGVKTLNRNVTWADEKHVDGLSGGNLCKIQEIKNKPENSKSSGTSEAEDDGNSLRFASAEACAIALTQAAEAVASGHSDVLGAVDEAGIIILPSPKEADEENSSEDLDMLESKRTYAKWPSKPVLLDSDILDSEDSWHDTPPEGFSLMASSQDEFLCVDGREYPHKIVLSDGRSAEIKQTLAGCLARALPGLVTNFRLPTPISTIEKAMVSRVMCILACCSE